MNALDTMRALASSGEVIQVPAGSMVFKAGESGDCMFGLLEGTVDTRLQAEELAFVKLLGARFVDGKSAFAGSTADQIKAMSKDTQQLIETQKSLMGMLGSMKPMLNDGKELMDTFQQMFGQ
jgi:CRP-like cAMP-binding protein